MIPLIQAETLKAQNTIAQPDTSNTPTITGALLRSTLLPGFGQLYQERIAESALFFYSNMLLYYSGAYYWEQYDKFGKTEDHNLMVSSFSAAALVHILNLVDIYDAATYENPKFWFGELLSDTPVKSPLGAVMRSAMLPGWGQAYCENYFRAAGAFAVNTYLAYLAIYYNNLLDKTKNKSYRDDRSRYSWYLGGAYLLNIADALASAYLYKFDEAVRLTVTPQLYHKKVIPNISISIKF
jgi:hypothetical protein